MRSSIYQNVRTDREYRSATGLSKAQFEQLAVKFKEYYQVVEWEFPQNFGHERAIKQAEEGLFLVLFYLKSYPVLDVLAMSFGMSRGAVSRYLTLFKSILKAVLQQEGVLPHRCFESKQQLEEALKDVPLLRIDATERPTQRPGNEQQQQDQYSGKKNSIL
jgi:hypothetical protein